MGVDRITDMPASAGITADALLEISERSTTVDITATTISALAADNSFNDSANGFVAAGFAVDDRVGVFGFTGNVANNLRVGVVTALTAGKMTIGGTDGDVIVDDAAGESVTIFKWVSRSARADDIAGLAGGVVGVDDEGSTVVAAASILNFVGAGVTVTDLGGGEAEINIAGGGGGGVSGARWTPAGNNWTAVGLWDAAVDGAESTVDFVDLPADCPLLFLADNVNTSVGGVIAVRVSTNNGVSFHSTSGNYVTLADNGGRSNADAYAVESAGAGVRTAQVFIDNVPDAPKPISIDNRNIKSWFVANTSDINAVRFFCTGGGSTLNAGKIYCFALLPADAGAADINAQVGTTYTLALSDAENIVELTNAAAITLTIPANATVAFPVGTVIELHQGGAGTVTVAAAGGVTLQSRGGAEDLAGQHAIAAVRKVATNTWRLTGDIV
jgi:hypothetical protein